MRTLIVRRFKVITDPGLAHLKGLKELRTLYLHRTQVTDTGLAHLKRLRELQTLDLGETQITDAGLAHLKGLKELQILGLRGCEQVTKEGLTDLRKALPNATIMR